MQKCKKTFRCSVLFKCKSNLKEIYLCKSPLQIFYQKFSFDVFGMQFVISRLYHLFNFELQWDLQTLVRHNVVWKCDALLTSFLWGLLLWKLSVRKLNPHLSRLIISMMAIFAIFQLLV